MADKGFPALFLSLSLIFLTCCGGKSETPKLPGPGTQAPGFTCLDLNGRSRSLDQTREKIILLRFWADWCPYCRFEMPVIEKYYRLLKDQGFEVLAVNVKQSAQVAEAFIGQMDLTFPVLLDPEGRVAESYGVYAIPTNFLIDGQGKIREILVGEVFREEKILRDLLQNYFPGIKS